jgi:hypothetical protein
MPRKIDKNKRNYTSGFSELRRPRPSRFTFVSKFLIVGVHTPVFVPTFLRKRTMISHGDWESSITDQTNRCRRPAQVGNSGAQGVLPLW